MEPLARASDEELMRLMLAGDEEAFNALYQREQGGVYRFALQMSGSAAVAEDVTQEVFLLLMSRGSRYDPTRGSVRAFLFGITRNRVRRHRQRGGVYVSLPEGQEDERFSRPPSSPDCNGQLGNLARAEQIESVRRAVLSLPLRYREVVVLCELQELSYEEAATVAGCSVGTIRSRLHRARALLGKKLQESAGESFTSRKTRPQPSPAKRCPV